MKKKALQRNKEEAFAKQPDSEIARAISKQIENRARRLTQDKRKENETDASRPHPTHGNTCVDPSTTIPTYVSHALFLSPISFLLWGKESIESVGMH